MFFRLHKVCHCGAENSSPPYQLESVFLSQSRRGLEEKKRKRADSYNRQAQPQSKPFATIRPVIGRLDVPIAPSLPMVATRWKPPVFDHRCKGIG
jgi:hypothetical protein